MGTISYCSTLVCSRSGTERGCIHMGTKKNQAVHSETGPETGQYRKVARYDIIPFSSLANRSGTISYCFPNLFGIYG